MMSPLFRDFYAARMPTPLKPESNLSL